jgi:hypothetical protein
MPALSWNDYALQPLHLLRIEELDNKLVTLKLGAGCSHNFWMKTRPQVRTRLTPPMESSMQECMHYTGNRKDKHCQDEKQSDQRSTGILCHLAIRYVHVPEERLLSHSHI